MSKSCDAYHHRWTFIRMPAEWIYCCKAVAHRSLIIRCCHYRDQLKGCYDCRIWICCQRKFSIWSRHRKCAQMPSTTESISNRKILRTCEYFYFSAYCSFEMVKSQGFFSINNYVFFWFDCILIVFDFSLQFELVNCPRWKRSECISMFKQ